MSVSRNAVRVTTQSLTRQPVASTSSSAHIAFSSPQAPPSSRTLSSSSTTSTESRIPSSSPSKLPSNSPAVHLPPLARKDPQLYAALRPPPISAIAALAARINLLPQSLDAHTRAKRIQLVHQACTHPSFRDLLQKASDLQSQISGPGIIRAQGETPIDTLQYLKQDLESFKSNATLATVGNSLLGMLASEFLYLRYPNLPTRVLKAAVAAFVGPNTLLDVGSQIGLGGQGILRWNREAKVASNHNTFNGAPNGAHNSRALFLRDVSSDAMRALVAIIFQEQGLSATRNFVNTHFLSRHFDLASLLKFQNPKRVLASTCVLYGRDPPQSRMIAESGRLSISPIFVVGVWSGKGKLGEGSGTSIKMAEHRAAEDALRRLFLVETPLGDFDVPSSTLDPIYPPNGPVFVPTTYPERRNTIYTPQPLGTCEVLLAAGKSNQ